ncbi:MAG: VWA domain-containing protein [Deltaproteobacteria bacterium]|nr:VWA domain-containing protein [Deltaproteobacteria bacterium]
MLRFEHPLALLSFVPLIMLVTIFNRRAAALGDQVLGYLALGLCILGLTRPQLGQSVVSRLSGPGNLILAIDVSRSMTTGDLLPSRLGFATAFANQLIQQINSGRVAVFPFAADGYLFLPLTTDISLAQQFLPSLAPEMVSDQGTDLSAALDSLFQSLSKMEHAALEKGEQWVLPQVVLLSDGESHHPLSFKTLAHFQSKRIPIFTVGTGTSEGALIRPHGRLSGPVSADQTGAPVQTKLVTDTLVRISSATGGTYFPAQLNQVSTLAQRLQQAHTSTQFETAFKVQRELYPLFFLLALVLFFGEFCRGQWAYLLRLLIAFILTAGYPLCADEEENLLARFEASHGERRSILAFNMGHWYQQKNDPGKAHEFFSQSANQTQDPSLKKKALFNLGNTLLALNDPVQALAAYQTAYDLQTSVTFDESTNPQLSKNMDLAARMVEQMRSRTGTGGQSGPGGTPTDTTRTGPEHYQTQSLNEAQKKHIFDAVSADEQQALQRIFRERNNRQARSGERSKPW